MTLNKSTFSNIPKSIEDKLGRSLHNQTNHPICIIKNLIYKYFDGIGKFDKFDTLNPIVSVADNFDKLLIPTTHPARSKSDTYYVDENHVLRTQTSAHQNELLEKGYTQFLLTGDVYRKDEIDRHHYPVFHQMEGVSIVGDDVEPKEELLKVLSGLVKYLFPSCEYRINDDYFPFTNPSFEIEVKYSGVWIEVLGCGVMQPLIAKNCGWEDKKFWAFGLGLDRLALILFKIPDIRYLWSTHSRFLDQFNNGKITEFKPYSELPSQYNDISFWVGTETKKWDAENDFYSLIRDIAGDWCERVECCDTFTHPKTKRTSRMYRITYSPNSEMKNPSEFTTIINTIQNKIRDCIEKKLSVELR